MNVAITPEWLAMVSGAILSLLFSYLPGLSDWYDPLEKTQKQLIMAGLLAVVTGGAFALGCADILHGVDCTRTGAVNVIYAFVMAMMANQATYKISPRATKTA